ncbi:RNA 2',3'-cyclic phosphodiesterase [Georgenia deserti]|uniref:RNA 2',3'-cyclic phosphodiesterase n=1 Tax=Georgenia deserti TaxID=2093781 RepID=A0ABW4L729_9MICO
MRLFVSLDLPTEVCAHLDLAVRSVTELDPAPLPGRGRPALRWTPAEQRHLTVAFYGEVPDGAVGDLREDLAATAREFAPVELRLQGAGVFSGQTLWAGVHETSPRLHSEERSDLMRLMAACEEVGARHLAPPAADAVRSRDRRRAHVTLARSRDRRLGEVELRRRARALAVYTGPEWTAEAMTLVRSELGAGRGGTALHTPVARLPLGGAS